MTTHTTGMVYRWYVFDIIEALQRRPRYVECDPPGPELPVATDQLAVAVGGGTVRVDGVDVTHVTRESSVGFEPARAYLLIGMLCGDDWLSLSRSAASVFEVTPGGTIRSQIGPVFQFSKEIESLGTVDALREYLRAH